MDDHIETRKSYGSDRAQLVYGLKADGTLAHITEVERGLACCCVCPACRGQLVARTKADNHVPHFAHHSGEACGGGPETVLHLLAKEAFRANPKMLLPERLSIDKRKRVVMKPSVEVETEFLRIEYTDPKKIIPDLYVRALGYDLFVEVAVTHASDEVKIQRLRKHGIPAIEVNLSRLPRDSTREAIAEAVLRSAPRHWLFHPNIDGAEAKKRADEEKWRAALEKREVGAQVKHNKRVSELAEAYRKALQDLAGMRVAVRRYAELQEVGLAEHIGIEVAGHACFTVPTEVWQAIILTEVFHDRSLGNGVCKAIPITEHLEKAKLTRPQFRRVHRDLADDVAALEPLFAPPWKAVDAYLERMAGAGVLIQYGYGMVLAKRFAEPWHERTLAEKQRTAVMHAVVQSVEWILSHLPNEERGNMTGESWLDSIHIESGMTYRTAIQSDSEAPKVAAAIDAVVALMEKRGPLLLETVGLPIAGAIERRKAQMAVEVERLREKQIQDANRLRETRRDRLCVDAEKTLSGPELGEFLNTKHNDLKGMTPLEAAEDSETGLNRARDLLSNRARQQAQEAEAAAEQKRYRDEIIGEAKRRLGADLCAAFLNGRDDEFGRLTPLVFVKDDRSYRKALGKLTEWEREAGRGQ